MREERCAWYVCVLVPCYTKMRVSAGLRSSQRRHAGSAVQLLYAGLAQSRGLKRYDCTASHGNRQTYLASLLNAVASQKPDPGTFPDPTIYPAPSSC